VEGLGLRIFRNSAVRLRPESRESLKCEKFVFEPLDRIQLLSQIKEAVIHKSWGIWERRIAMLTP
jgi:hypothetical protein